MIISKEIIIGSRTSTLAIKQTEIFISKLRKVGANNIRTLFIKSKGDKVNNNKFKSLGGKGLFTKDIDELIINKKIDFGVHSAKDIPAYIDKRLEIGAYLKREDVRDVLITKSLTINNIYELPKNCSLGTSSPRRAAYIKKLRPDIKVVSLRGNITSRIAKVIKGRVFSIIIAKAGINRLKIKDLNININPIPITKILPSPGQGAIAIVYKKNNSFNKKLSALVDNTDTRITLSAERALIKKINGNCFTPLAALAKIKENKIVIKARLFSNDGNEYVEEKLTGPVDKATLVGNQCAKNLLKYLSK